MLLSNLKNNKITINLSILINIKAINYAFINNFFA